MFEMFAVSGAHSSIPAKHAPVAQLDRALDYESRGQEFESLRARHNTIPQRSMARREMVPADRKNVRAPPQPCPSGIKQRAARQLCAICIALTPPRKIRSS